MLTIITMANAQVNVYFLENGRVEHYLLHAGHNHARDNNVLLFFQSIS
jgi:hypothetical protein